MLDKISAYCSIAGFIISILTLGYAFFIEKKVSQFEKKVLFNVRVPVLAKNLKQHISRFSQNLQDENERSIRETLNLCKTIVETIIPNLPSDLSLKADGIYKILKRQYNSDFQLGNKKRVAWKFWIKVITIDDLWKSYDNLNSLIMHIEDNKLNKKVTQ